MSDIIILSLPGIGTLARRILSRIDPGAARWDKGAMHVPHRTEIRVYYEDTDFSGFVYHTSYLRFIERGRTEFLRAHGIRHSTLAVEHQGLVLVVSRLTVDYLRPARMDDLLVVETRLGELRRASMRLDQSILRDGTLLLRATVLVAAVRGGRAVRLPDMPLVVGASAESL